MANNWGQAWVKHIEAMNLDAVGLDRGRNYALSEWRLELEVEPGKASTEARAGRRVAYHATLNVPEFTEAEIETLVGIISSSTSATAALLDGALDSTLLAASENAGLNILPTQVTAECDCRHAGAVCRHVGAVVYLLGDAIEADPFELLRLRGTDRADLVKAVSSSRSGMEIERPAGTELADDALKREPADLPDEAPLRKRAGKMAPFPSDPPASAPFSAEGLRRLSTDAAKRAIEILNQTA